MGLWSIIDFGLQDFLRNDADQVIKIEGDYHDAENWLLERGDLFGWTNQGVRYWDWEDEGD